MRRKCREALNREVVILSRDLKTDPVAAKLLCDLGGRAAAEKHLCIVYAKLRLPLKPASRFPTSQAY